jgi:acyl transferase domain-containing protein
MSFSHRRFVVAGNVGETVEWLQTPNPVRSASRELKSPSSGVAFMFPGQGSQYVGMGANLYRDEIVFKEAVDRCAELFAQHLGYDIRTILYPAKGGEEKAAANLQQTSNTQPALFTIGYALAKLWMSWGIYPQALAGHSIGEFAAACNAGSSPRPHDAGTARWFNANGAYACNRSGGRVTCLTFPGRHQRTFALCSFG